MVITYRNIKNCNSGLLKVFFIEKFGLYGRTTIKELLKIQYEFKLNLSGVIHKHFKLSGIAQIYYNDVKKLHKWLKFKNGKVIRFLVYFKSGGLVTKI